MSCANADVEVVPAVLGGPNEGGPNEDAPNEDAPNEDAPNEDATSYGNLAHVQLGLRSQHDLDRCVIAPRTAFFTVSGKF